MNTALVFGYGGVGKKCKAYLESHGVEVIAFVDNDNRKWGKFFEGIKIIPPREISFLTYQQVAIGNYKAADFIKQQLLGLGVEASKIVIPFEPRRIFRNESIPVSTNSESWEVKQEERLTQWYQGLGLQLTDAAFMEKLHDLKSVLRKYNIHG